MHPARALAEVLVDEWIRCGGRDAVLCPGSRSAPLAYALEAAERAGRIRLHVRIDERTAGFLALGLGKLTRRPALLVTTSGTAVANLHPAVLEAHHGAVPVLVMSADRPAGLRGTGANQTTDQPGIFGAHVRFAADIPAPVAAAGQVRYWRSTVARAWVSAVGSPAGPAAWPGPVHLNVGLADPLVPDDLDDGEDRGVVDPAPWPEPLDGRPGGAPWLALTAQPDPRAGLDRASGVSAASGQVAAGQGEDAVRVLVVVGDLPDPAQARWVVRLAAARNYPVITEPFGRSGGGEPGPAGVDGAVLPHGPSVLAVTELVENYPPDRVLVVGRITLSREVGALLARPGLVIEAVTASPQWADPGHRAQRVHPITDLADLLDAPVDESWARRWCDTGRAVAAAAEPVVSGGWPTGPAVATAVLGALGAGDILVLGSSNTVRDVDLAAGPHLDPLPLIVANRGLAGIDGTVSTATGIAIGSGRRVTALLGDLTLLHDLNGLLLGPSEQRPDLDLVVVNDDGGGIFGTLEHGEPTRLRGAGAARFDRIFGTPTGADLGALCAGLGVEHHPVQSRQDLIEQLADRQRTGPRVLEITIPRDGHRAGRERLRSAVRAIVVRG